MNIVKVRNSKNIEKNANIKKMKTIFQLDL